ncbi:MAG: Polyphosphate:AMP phosphotransferase [Moraxellaceae bacterium]|jgi:polyphosphate:AMP phosphotransferase|nr:Polyphosphate:AMP phosphotransferase [Moraxellaceae bacterium]
MFEAAETGQRLSKKAYKERETALRQALLAAQYRLLEAASFPVIIIVGGVDGAGKGETVNLFNEWMDPRHISTFGFGEPSDEERQRPPMWRFWRTLPPKGRIGMLFGSWYTAPIVDHVTGRTTKRELNHAIGEIRDFEAMLATEGAVIVKLWFHLSKKAQRQRLIELESDPLTRWRVSELDWERFRSYARFRTVSEHALKETSADHAPWHIIDGADPYHRSLSAGQILLDALQTRLKARGRAPKVPAPAQAAAGTRHARHDVLATLDYDARLGREAYEQQLELWQGRLNLLTRDARFRQKSLVLVFEGQDAAGKGGAIRRITAALDARQYQVIPVAAPSDEERAQPWLWRFWRQLPGRGHIAVFDRSWYGRVLVERVEKFCAKADWQRAFAEINAFEQQLARHDIIVVKFFMAITKDEQLARFSERASVKHKNHKLTPEDWRNREKWDDYGQAINDMVRHTDSPAAPWTLVPANDVEHARIAILRTLCERLEAAMRERRLPAERR